MPMRMLRTLGSSRCGSGEGVGYGVSVKLAPSVRLRATHRGIRATVGTGPTAGSRGRGPIAQARPTLAELSDQARTADKAEAVQQVLHAERLLTTQHVVDFPASQQPVVAPPEPVDVDRIEKVFRRQAMADLGWFARRRRWAARIEAKRAASVVANELYAQAVEEAERLQSEYHAYWNALSAHDRDTVVAAVDSAFADNAPESTCVDSGIDPDSGPYVSCVVTFGHPDLVPDRTVAMTPKGRPALKERSKTDLNNMYVAAMASTVLATVREALAVAPAANEVRMVVVRDERAGTSQPRNRGLSAIYAGTFRRHQMESISWRTIDTEAELLCATGAEFVRTEVARSVVALGANAQRRMAPVLHAFADLEDEEGTWGD